MVPRAKYDPYFILVLWRRAGSGEAEFFMPVEGHEASLRFMVMGTAAETALRIMKFRYKIVPQGNVRVFRPDGTEVMVAFCLNEQEADAIGDPGIWLGADLISKTGTKINEALAYVANRL